jgi:hypothetical protein
MLRQPPPNDQTLEMSRPVLNIFCSPRRYIGSISEAHMEHMRIDMPLFENDGSINRSRRHRAPILEKLIQDSGVPINDTNLRLTYSMQTPAIERGFPARFSVSVLADTVEEIDQFYDAIMQVLEPFLV